MDNFGWYLIGILAAFFSASNLENARRQKSLDVMKLLFAGGAGFLLFKNQWLISSHSDEQLVAIALGFCALSPLLGWLWWGKGGAIRRGIGRMLLFLILWVVATVIWSFVAENPLVAVVLGAVTALVPFRWGKWRARARSRRQQRQWSRDKHRQKEALAAEQRSKGELERKQGEMLDALIDELKR